MIEWSYYGWSGRSVPQPNVEKQKFSMRVENFIETSHWNFDFRHAAAVHLCRSRGTQVRKHIALYCSLITMTRPSLTLFSLISYKHSLVQMTAVIIQANIRYVQLLAKGIEIERGTGVGTVTGTGKMTGKGVRKGRGWESSKFEVWNFIDGRVNWREPQTPAKRL